MSPPVKEFSSIIFINIAIDKAGKSFFVRKGKYEYEKSILAFL